MPSPQAAIAKPPPRYPLLAPRGSAAAPSYSFADFPNYGMYAAGFQLNLTVAGSNAFRVTQQGPVTLGGSGGSLDYSFNNRGKLRAESDGNYLLTNQAGTGITKLALGVSTLGIFVGSGAPLIAADPGSLYIDTGGGAGTTLYVKESGTGAAGWVAK